MAQFEEEAYAIAGHDHGKAALVSIAISMKRIADELAGVPYVQGTDNTGHRLGLVDGIMHAIEQGLLSASHRG